MKPIEHIEKLLKDTHAIQEHGHCTDNGPAWVAINDIEIGIHELRKAFERKISHDKNDK